MYVITVKQIGISEEFSGACVYWAILVSAVRLIDVRLQGWNRPLPCAVQLSTDKHGDCVGLCSYLEQEDEHQEARCAIGPQISALCPWNKSKKPG